MDSRTLDRRLFKQKTKLNPSSPFPLPLTQDIFGNTVVTNEAGGISAGSNAGLAKWEDVPCLPLLLRNVGLAPLPDAQEEADPEAPRSLPVTGADSRITTAPVPA